MWIQGWITVVEKLDGLAVRRRPGSRGGQGLVEYALMLSLVALVLILAVTLLGHKTTTLYSNVSNSLPN